MSDLLNFRHARGFQASEAVWATPRTRTLCACGSRLENLWIWVRERYRLEPGHPGRLLEQRCQEPPLRVPQQRRPGQSLVQQRRSPCGLTPNRPDVLRPRMQDPRPGNDQSSRTRAARASRGMDEEKNAPRLLVGPRKGIRTPARRSFFRRGSIRRSRSIFRTHVRKIDTTERGNRAAASVG